MEVTNLKIVTYNLHGIRQGLPFLQYLGNSMDIIFTQEHWLAPFNINSLDDVLDGFTCYATSAMNDSISQSILCGRPFGGVAVFVRQHIATKITVIKLASRYIILKFGTMLLINAYLPCTSRSDWEDVYMETLACISNDVYDVQYSYIIWGGDFNVDFKLKHPLRHTICDMMDDLSLCNVKDKLPSDAKCSFRVDTTGASSLIDHIFVSIPLYELVTSVEIVDSGINLSDHCAVVMELKLPLENQWRYVPQNKHKPCWYKWRWDKADLWKYYLRTSEYLNTIDVPVYLLYGESPGDSSKQDIQIAIDGFYQSIVNALQCAASECVPRKSREFYKFWWDEELSALKQASIESFNIWVTCGKPKHGNEFDAMKRDKMAYKLMIRRKERSSQNEFSNSLNDALLQKEMGDFWCIWKSKFGNSSRVSVVDGSSNEQSIADTFASVFKSVCQPNSQVRHEQLKSEFFRKFHKYTCNSYVMSCTVELVDECMRNLKHGKAAGHDDLTAEHIQYAHPLLMVLISLLFNMVILHGMVPSDFARGIMIPLIKNNEGNKTSSDNYRGITLSPVISKLFEMVLLKDLQQYLYSDCLQFGFKKKASCSQAIFTLRSVVEQYTKVGSTVSVCALDISKAYDRVDQHALLNLLMDRKVPKYFINVMLSWFEKGCAYVRWGNAISFTFTISAGVRQGGLLSPLLFAVYMDVLINRLRNAGYGCKLVQRFLGCLLYADDIVLLAHSLNAIRLMLRICDEFATEFDMKFNSSKSIVMRIGDRYKAKCEPLMLAGCELQFVQSFKYLGVQFVASKKLKCSVDNARLKFYKSFNAIYSRSKGAQSELVTLQLFKSYCLPCMLYATEVLPLSKHSLNTLDFCVSQAVAKIFNVRDKDCIKDIRLACNVPDVRVMIERRRMKFVNNMLDFEHLRCLGLFCVNC